MCRLPEAAWFEPSPDWVCEILSPSTSRTDRAIKMPVYAREGVAHLWLVDPDAQTLEVYALQEDRRWLLLDTLKEGDRVSQPPFESVTFALDALWA
jgi:Uma2 family endonuclease